jgi:(2Fe-2S) ferredoxin
MNSSRFRVFVCTKQCDSSSSEQCCGNVGAMEIYRAFKSEIEQRQLGNRVEVRQSGCLDRCEAGAVVMVSKVKSNNLAWLPMKIQKRILPNKHWYTYLTVADIPEIVERHFVNNQP